MGRIHSLDAKEAVARGIDLAVLVRVACEYAVGGIREPLEGETMVKLVGIDRVRMKKFMDGIYERLLEEVRG